MKSVFLPYGVVSFLLVLSGCAHYSAVPLDAETSLDVLVSRSLSNPNLREFVTQQSTHAAIDWPPSYWDLNSLTLAAFFFHPDLELASTQLEVASANIRTAGMRPNPTLALSPAYNGTTSIPTPWIVGGRLNIPLETAGKRSFRVDAAEHLASAAQLNMASRAWAIRNRVRLAFLELWSASQLATAQTKRLEAQIDVVHFLDTRYIEGDVSRVELSNAQMELERVRIEALSAQNADLTAHASLAGSIGISTEALQGIQFDFGIFENIPIDVSNPELRRAPLFNRADVLSGLYAYASAESTLQLEIARQYPDITLSPGHNYDQGEGEWQLGLSFQLPILNRNQGPIAAAEAQRKLRAAEFHLLQGSVLLDIENALAAYDAAKAIYQSADNSIREASTQLELALAMYPVG